MEQQVHAFTLETDRLKAKIENGQSNDYRRLQEIVRQEYEFKFHQLETTSKQAIEDLKAELDREKSEFLTMKNSEFEQTLDREVERLEREKVEAHAAATQ